MQQLLKMFGATPTVVGCALVASGAVFALWLIVATVIAAFGG